MDAKGKSPFWASPTSHAHRTVRVMKFLAVLGGTWPTSAGGPNLRHADLTSRAKHLVGSLKMIRPPAQRQAFKPLILPLVCDKGPLCNGFCSGDGSGFAKPFGKPLETAGCGRQPAAGASVDQGSLCCGCFWRVPVYINMDNP